MQPCRLVRLWRDRPARLRSPALTGPRRAQVETFFSILLVVELVWLVDGLGAEGAGTQEAASSGQKTAQKMKLLDSPPSNDKAG
jgi:hypothetical protein